MTIANILIAEGDPSLNNQLAGLLELDGHNVDQCFEGNLGLEKAVDQKYQLIVVDSMLPQRDGISLLKVLRKTSQTPVIMLAPQDCEEMRIKGLMEGADDSIAKPFSNIELRLRVGAILRRTLSSPKVNQLKSLNLEGLYMDAANRRVCVNERDIEFTPIQFKLLWLLVINRGETLTKAYLYQTVLNRSLGKHDRSLDMHLSRVRRKLVDAKWTRRSLQTIHGKGYCIE